MPKISLASRHVRRTPLWAALILSAALALLSGQLPDGRPGDRGAAARPGAATATKAAQHTLAAPAPDVTGGRPRPSRWSCTSRLPSRRALRRIVRSSPGRESPPTRSPSAVRRSTLPGSASGPKATAIMRKSGTVKGTESPADSVPPGICPGTLSEQAAVDRFDLCLYAPVTVASSATVVGPCQGLIVAGEGPGLKIRPDTSRVATRWTCVSPR